VLRWLIFAGYVIRNLARLEMRNSRGAVALIVGEPPAVSGVIDFLFTKNSGLEQSLRIGRTDPARLTSYTPQNRPTSCLYALSLTHLVSVVVVFEIPRRHRPTMSRKLVLEGDA